MLAKTDVEIARAFKERVSRDAKLVELRVYGSRARGDNEQCSDLDIFVEAETVTPAVRERVADIAWELSLKHLIHVSPLVFSRYEIEQTPQRSSPVVLNIGREGVLI